LASSLFVLSLSFFRSLSLSDLVSSCILESSFPFPSSFNKSDFEFSFFLRSPFNLSFPFLSLDLSLMSLDLACASSESIELSSSPSAVEELVSSLLLSCLGLLCSSNSWFKQSTFFSAYSNSPSASTIKSLIESSSFIHSWRFSLNLVFLSSKEPSLPEITLSSSLSLPRGEDYTTGLNSDLSSTG
jgi:hypothetical protein